MAIRMDGWAVPPSADRSTPKPWPRSLLLRSVAMDRAVRGRRGPAGPVLLARCSALRAEAQPERGCTRAHRCPEFLVADHRVADARRRRRAVRAASVGLYTSRTRRSPNRGDAGCAREVAGHCDWCVELIVNTLR